MSKTPFLAAASLFQLWTQCGGGSATVVPPNTQLNTATYLDSALDAQNLFHWTPRAAGEAVELHVVLHNAAGELPSGFDHYMIGAAEIETLVVEGLTAWTEATAVPFDLQLHAASNATEPPADRCLLEVSFVSGGEAPLSGFAWLETRFLDPRTVEKVMVEISVPDAPVDVQINSVRALLLHEFGHALGIVAPQPHTGHSPSVQDVMHPAVRWVRLSAADRVAMTRLYAMQPNIMRGDVEDPGTGSPGAPGAPEPPDATESAPISPLSLAQRVLQPLAEWAEAKLLSPAPTIQAAKAGVFDQVGCRGCR